MGLLWIDVQKPNPDDMHALGQKYTFHRLNVTSMELTQITITVDKDQAITSILMDQDASINIQGKKNMNEYDFYCIICGKSLHEAEHEYCKECEKKREHKVLYFDGILN